MSKRSEILSYVKGLLSDAEIIDGPVFDSETRAYTLEELPCALVLISKEEAEVFSESPVELKKCADLSVQVIGEHTEGAEIEVHDVLSDIEHVLLTDDSLGNLVSRVRLDSIEMASFLQGERPIISGTVKIKAHYYEKMTHQDDSQPLNAIELKVERMIYGT